MTHELNFGTILMQKRQFEKKKNAKKKKKVLKKNQKSVRWWKLIAV